MSYSAGCYDLSRIRPKVQSVLRRVNTLGRDKFTARSVGIDIDASFPVENYRDWLTKAFLVCASRLNSAAWDFRCSNTPWSRPKLPNTAAQPR